MRSPTKAARAGIPNRRHEGIGRQIDPWNWTGTCLRGLEAFARGNFARMHRLETSDADTNARITALEERVLMLETRPRPPQ
jgi:hypothetical protein